MTACSNERTHHNANVVAQLFGERLDNEKKTLVHLNDVNLAHVLMLRSVDIIDTTVAQTLLTKLMEIDQRGLDALGPLGGQEGLYLAYEASLIDELGIDVGGALHTARSRNDLGSTIHRMHTRTLLLGLCDALAHLRDSLLKAAVSHVSTVMTGYTHLQPAQPLTLGHWMLAIEAAITRDTVRVLAALECTDAMPLGACALAGTDFPIRQDMTAELLGFGTINDNSLDAIATRDYAAETLGACAILAMTLSRAATDLHTWYTHEFNYFSLAPELSGSSSIMPQKKNPVALEIIKGRSAQAITAPQALLMAQKNTSYSNVIDVNRESLAGFDSAVGVTVDLVRLTSAVIDGLRVDDERMALHAARNFSTVTLLANYLVRERDYSFRAAYRVVKQLVETATSNGYISTDLTPEMLDIAAGKPLQIPEADLRDMLDPKTSVDRLQYGSGPSSKWNEEVIQRRRKRLEEDRQQIASINLKFKSARAELLKRASDTIADEYAPRA